MSGRWLGVHLKNEGALSAEDLLACAGLAERLGYSGVTVNEDVGYDAFALLCAIAVGTESIELGTAIVNVYCRSAMQLAMGANTLDTVSHGRAFLGLSVGHHPWNDVYHGIPLEPPLPRLREYVAFLRGALSGEEYRHDGRIFNGVVTRLGVPPLRADLPIFIGGDRSGMLGLAGELADGALMNVVGADYIAEFAADRFFSAARAAGRDPSSLELTAIVTCCLTEDPEQALDAARRNFVRRVASNPEKLMATRPQEAAAEIAHLSELVRRGETERAVAEASVELVTATIAIGGAEEIGRAVERYFEAGCTRVLLASGPRTRRDVEALLEALAPAGRRPEDGAAEEREGRLGTLRR